MNKLTQDYRPCPHCGGKNTGSYTIRGEEVFTFEMIQTGTRDLLSLFALKPIETNAQTCARGRLRTVISERQNLKEEKVMEIEPTQSEFEVLRKALSEIFCLCVEEGMEMPHLIAAVALNGTGYIVRFSGRNEPELLAEHVEPNGLMVAPINIMIVDQTGAAARAQITMEGVQYH